MNKEKEEWLKRVDMLSNLVSQKGDYIKRNVRVSDFPELVIPSAIDDTRKILDDLETTLKERGWGVQRFRERPIKKMRTV